MELKLCQGWACLTGLAFAAIAPTVWGYCAAIGATFLILPFVMAADLNYAPVEFGGLWAVVLVGLGLRLRKLARQPPEDADE